MRFRPVGGVQDANVEKIVSPNKRTLVCMDETLKSKDGFFMKSKAITPSKRQKPAMELRYPKDIPVPDTCLIKSLYTKSLAVEGSHQSALDEVGCGLLSLEEVIVPAVGMEEDKALKKLQAQAQRDGKEHIKAIKECRVAILESIGHGVACGKDARQLREINEQRKEMELIEQEKAAKEERRRIRHDERKRRKEERKKAREEEKHRVKLEMKKKLPRNVEKWNEVLFLRLELAKIKKEEKLWKEAGIQLEEREKEVSALEEESKGRKDNVNEEVADSSETMRKYEERLTHAIEGLSLSTRRIQRAIGVVAQSVVDCEKSRKDLYKQYRDDHMFYGYQRVKNPKSLIMALSQEG